MAELEYRASTTPEARDEVLQRMRNVVLATADFLADFPVWNTETMSFDLGPPVLLCFLLFIILK
jgi:hypothetical protein